MLQKLLLKKHCQKWQKWHICRNSKKLSKLALSNQEKDEEDRDFEEKKKEKEEYLNEFSSIYNKMYAKHKDHRRAFESALDAIQLNQDYNEDDISVDGLWMSKLCS